MKGKRGVAAAATAAIVALLEAGPGPVAQAADAVVRVPCSTSKLASAMSEASSGQQLILARGCVYVLTVALPAVGQNLTIAGQGATLERSYVPGTAVFTILTVGTADLAISKLNFRNGDGAISVGSQGALTVNGGTFLGNAAADGGAIDSNGTTAPQVTGATFIKNTATDSGGAINSNSAADGLTVSQSTFTRNTAANEGGAIYSTSAASGLTASQSTFTKNTAANEGGAVYDWGEDAGVYTSTFRQNSAGAGGALWLSEDLGELVTNVTVRDNAATGDGGGIDSPAGGGLDLAHSEIDGNYAGGNGGGVYDWNGQGSGIVDTVIRENSAEDGGGVYSAGDDAPVTAFVDSTIAGNHARGYGGGIYNLENATATGTRVTRNTAASGGGGISTITYDESSGVPITFTLTNSAVRANQPDNCAPSGSITNCTG
jgi:predicted outer membrane repeat protein